MKKISQQTMLKGALFAVLAANINWTSILTSSAVPAGHLNESQWASSKDQPGGDVAGTKQAAPAAAAPAAPSTDTTLAPPTEYVEVCQFRFGLYETPSSDPKNPTQVSFAVTAKNHERVYGNYSATGPLLDIDDIKSNAISQVKDQIKQNLLARGFNARCADPVQAAAPAPVTQTTQDSTSDDDIKFCVKDAAGRDFRSTSGQYNCLLRNIQRLQYTSDPDALESTKGDFETFFQDIKDNIKSKITSPDGDEVDLDDLQTTIDTAKKAVDKAARTLKIKLSLRNKYDKALDALMNAAKLQNIAKEQADNVTQLQTSMQAAWVDYATTDQTLQGLVNTDPQLKNLSPAAKTAWVKQQLQSSQAGIKLNGLFAQESALATTINGAEIPYITALKMDAASGALSSTDRSDFLSPLNDLQQQLSSMIDPTQNGVTQDAPVNPYAATTVDAGNSASTMPADLDAARMRVEQAFRQRSNWDLPAQVPYRAVGAFGVNPALTASPVINNQNNTMIRSSATLQPQQQSFQNTFNPNTLGSGLNIQFATPTASRN